MIVRVLNLDESTPIQAENLRALVTVLVGLAIFTVIVTNWKQLAAMSAFAVVSVLIIGYTNWDPTLVTITNLALSALISFYGTNVRTIFK
jgi:ABC-type proline/glycine betaine transport system permease subunit